MTDHDLARALEKLETSVTDYRIDLGSKVATLTANVATLQKSHDESAAKLDKVIGLEQACPARAGFKSVNARIGNLETGEKLRIESELKQARDEIIGAVDVNGAKMKRPSRAPWGDSGGAFFRSLVWKALPYVLFGGVVLGAYLTSGGDNEAMTRALRAVSDAVAKMDTKVGQLEDKVEIEEAAAPIPAATAE
jgi:outer membrane murein-binding lipoprotein Lpp